MDILKNSPQGMEGHWVAGKEIHNILTTFALVLTNLVKLSPNHVSCAPSPIPSRLLHIFQLKQQSGKRTAFKLEEFDFKSCLSFIEIVTLER